MPGQDLEYYQIEPETKRPKRLSRWAGSVERLRTIYRVLKSLAIL